MKKIVTVFAVCLACITMVGFEVQASAVSVTNDKSIFESTLIEEDQIATEYLYQLGKKTKNKSKGNSKTKKGTEKKKSSKNKKVKKSISAIAVSEKKKQVEKNKKNRYTPAELKYMTCIIYCEARGETYAGQMAVGIVVMNRKRSKDFPNTIKKVIYERGQFTPTVNGSMSRALSLYEKYNDKGKFKGEMVSCYKAAKEVLKGTTTIKVDGKEKEMKNYLYFSQRVSGAKYTLGCHQFK